MSDAEPDHIRLKWKERSARVRKFVFYSDAVNWLLLNATGDDPADICPGCERPTLEPDADEKGARCSDRKKCGGNYSMIGLAMTKRKRGLEDVLQFYESRLHFRKPGKPKK